MTKYEKIISLDMATAHIVKTGYIESNIKRTLCGMTIPSHGEGWIIKKLDETIEGVALNRCKWCFKMMEKEELKNAKSTEIADLIGNEETIIERVKWLEDGWLEASLKVITKDEESIKSIIKKFGEFFQIKKTS